MDLPLKIHPNIGDFALETLDFHGKTSWTQDHFNILEQNLELLLDLDFNSTDHSIVKRSR